MESAQTEAMVKAKRGALEVALAHTVAVGLPAPSTPGRQPTAAAAAAWTDASEHGVHHFQRKVAEALEAEIG